MPKHTNQLHTKAKEENEALFSIILNISHDAIIATDQDQNIILFNQGAKRIFGYNASEVIGQPLEVLLPPTLSEIHRAHVRRFATALEVTRQMGERREIYGQRKDGTIFPAEASIAKLSTSVQTYFSVILRDITERKQAENALQESKQMFFTLFEKSAFTASLSRLPDGVITNVNEAFERAFGYTKQEVIGRTSLELGINPDEEGRARILAALKEHGSARNQELTLHTKSDEERIFSVNVDFLNIGDQKYILNTTQDITERKRAELETIRRLQNIQALQKIDQAIAGSLDLNLTLHVVLEQTKTELNVDAAAVLLFNPHTQILEFAAGIGFRNKAIERSRLRLGEGHGGRAALERKTVSIPNLLENTAEFIRAPLIADEGFVTYFSAPLIAKGQVKGVLEVFHRTPFIPNQDWLDFLEVLAGQTAIAVDSASLFTDLQHSNTELFNAYDSTIEGWSHALDLRDKETEGHTQRVTEMTLKLARAAGITEEELVHVRRGALLHDIGKMGVPDNILLKPDKLTDEEWVVMRKHPTFAFELLSPIAYLRPALDIPYCHHEKWDGSGYPRGLKGEQIPLAARLFAIIDVWDALLSDRPYRQGWPKEKVIEHIKSLSGIHFDPKAVESFLNMMNEDEKNTG